jgi:hypothetical protein
MAWDAAHAVARPLVSALYDSRWVDSRQGGRATAER